jgi:hypothetical protein
MRGFTDKYLHGVDPTTAHFVHHDTRPGGCCLTHGQLHTRLVHFRVVPARERCTSAREEELCTRAGCRLFAS